MSKRNQPYLHLYVQDVLSDEKLAQCNASAVGVYFYLVCLLTKMEDFGKILLKQKYKQKPKQTPSKRQAKGQANSKHLLDVCYNFACQLQRHLPFSVEVIQEGLIELLTEKVLHLDGDIMYQKRMVKDAKISHIRRKSGSEGGKKRIENLKKKEDVSNDEFASTFAQAKIKQKHDYDNDNNIDIGRGVVRGDFSAELLHVPDSIKNIFSLTYDELSTIGSKSICKDVDPEDFDEWKDFVVLCDNEQYGFYTEIFNTEKFVFPKDFKKLKTEKGFTRALWLPVIQKMLGSGITPAHNLYWRIQEVMRWLAKDNNGSNNKKSTDQSVKQTGSSDTDYSNNTFK